MSRLYAYLGRGAVLASVLAASLACAGCVEQPGSPAATPDEQEHAAAPAVIAPAVDQAVTVPAVFFESAWESNPESVLDEFGATDIVKNDDGSYAVVFAERDYQAFVDRVYQDARNAIDDLVENGEHPHVTAVDYDEQFATVTVTLDTTSLSAAETLLPYIPGEIACGYQQVAGLPVQCDVILVGPDGSNLLETVFPNEVGNAVEK